MMSSSKGEINGWDLGASRSGEEDGDEAKDPRETDTARRGSIKEARIKPKGKK